MVSSFFFVGLGNCLQDCYQDCLQEYRVLGDFWTLPALLAFFKPAPLALSALGRLLDLARFIVTIGKSVFLWFLFPSKIEIIGSFNVS